MDSTAKMANRGKRGSRGDRAVRRTAAVGSMARTKKDGSKGHTDREAQAYHRTGSHSRGDNVRPNHSQCRQHTLLLAVLLLTTMDVYEDQK